MKKAYICAFVVMTIALFCTAASASDDIVYIDGATGFPQTRIDDTVSLMSADEDETLEEVIIKGWETLSPSIDISKFRILPSDFQAIYPRILEENPIYFDKYTHGKASATRIKIQDVVYVAEVKPEYTCNDKEALVEYRQNIDRAVEEILFCIDDTMSDFNKIMTVHDYMVLNYQYDTTYKNHSMSMMYTKTGVCQSYAYVFKHMMNILGIDCTYVSSESMNHIWNLVRLDGKWYHMDITYDDPLTDKFGQVRHTYSLLSTNRLRSITDDNGNNTHYGFEIDDSVATSTKYDNADWHDGTGSVVYCNGNTYWWDDDDLVDSEGDEIVDDIIGNRKWIINKYYTFKNDDDIFPGLATYDDKLYYNSDSAIYCYDPATKIVQTIKSDIGICGLYIDKNTLYYSKVAILANGIEFEKGGEIVLADTSVGDSYRDGDTVVTRVCNTSEKPVTVFVFDGKNATSQLCGSGVSKVGLKTDSAATVFVWDSNLKPLASKQLVE